MYRFHKLIFHRGDSNIECLNRASQNYGLWLPVPVRYRTRKFFFFFYLRWVLLGWIRKDEECMFRDSVSVSVSIRRRYHLLVLTRREREHLLSVLESCFEALNCLHALSLRPAGSNVLHFWRRMSSCIAQYCT